MKNLFQNDIFWIGTFTLLFLLTQDYLFTNWLPSFSFLGLPKWLFWLMGVHFVFILIFIVFSKKYWKE